MNACTRTRNKHDNSDEEEIPAARTEVDGVDDWDPPTLIMLGSDQPIIRYRITYRTRAGEQVSTRGGRDVTEAIAALTAATTEPITVILTEPIFT